MIPVMRLCQHSGFLGLVIVASLGAAAAVAPSVEAAGQREPRDQESTVEAMARPIVFQMHWQPQAQFAGYLMAQEKGFFQKAGLNVEIRWSAAGERPFEQLVAGDADYCTGWLADAIVEKAQGLPLVHLAQILPQSSLMLVTWSRSGIRTPQDLTGKRVGLWGGNFEVPAAAFFRKYGVQPIVVPQSTSMVPFLRGAVDAASAMYYNEYHKLIESGISPDDLHSFRFADHGLVFPEDGIYGTVRTHRERPHVSAALVQVCRQGWEYALANEAETLEVVMRAARLANVRTNRNHQRWMLRAIHDAMRGPAGAKPAPWGTLSETAYSGVVTLLLDQNLIETAPGYHEFHQPPQTVREPRSRRNR